MHEATTQTDEFKSALVAYAPRFGLQIDAQTTAQLLDYYAHVNRWNARLHLVAPCSAEEFAVRHVLESLMALPFLTANACVADVGSGAGLPIIPCLIARADIQATLIESSQKKAVFLREALRIMGAQNRARAIADRFEKTATPDADFITCRALDRFTEMFSQLVLWSPPAATLLLFGGASLREEIESAALSYQSVHLPESEQRFLFVVEKAIDERAD